MKDYIEIVQKVSHDILLNINSILGITTILDEDKSSPAVSRYISTLRKNARHLLSTTNDLINYSNLEKGETGINKNKIDLSKTINNLVNEFRNKFEIDYVIEIDDNTPKEFIADEQKLKFILHNILLLSSANTARGRIVVNIEKGKKEKLSFKITDSSKGFKPVPAENITRPFQLRSLDHLKPYNLSGLILTLSEKYIELLGGKLTVLDEAGKGSVFEFTISGEEMPSFDSTLSKLPKPTDKNKVLVIEDDYATSRLLVNYLKKWGYDPKLVNTAEQTFELITRESFLAIILDIELPDYNGLELLKQLREREDTKNTPVIVCSVEVEQQKAYLMGAVEYFVKPINYNFLVEVLTNYKLRQDSNILCVDDDLPTLNLIKRAIETAGLKAIAENISANVMDRIANIDIDLAIVDLDMPHPNGFELIKLIKSNPKFKKLPIIIYTGKENFDEDLQKIDGLFDHLLQKQSVNIEDLGDTINSMIQRYETPPPVEEVIEKKEEGVIKILLAEDYKHSQIIVTRLLKKNGFENIVVVENGKEALDMATKEKFTLILMDMQMPIMNGFEATRNIREQPQYADTPIIALTAFAMKGDREKCLDAGATDYIPKPIDSKEFIEKVKHYTKSGA